MKAAAEKIRKYYKNVIVETDYIRPNITSNGTLGGDTFACASNNFPWSNTGLCYQMFDGVDGSFNGNGTNHNGGGWIKWYNPRPLKISNVICAAGYSGDWFDVTFRGSNDGTNWTDVAYFNHGVRQNCPVNSPDFYKYWMMYNNSGFGHDGNGYGGGISEIHITGIEKTEGVEEVLDPQFIERKYYKYQYSSWSQPLFTSATTWGSVSADNYYNEQPPYQALDGKTSGGNEADFASSNGTTVNWYWTFEEPLKITNIKMWNRAGADSYGGATIYTIYGLNNDNSYTQIGTISIGATGWASNETAVSNTNMFKGLKIYCSGSKNYVGIGEILLTAFTQSIVEGTEQDYDWYEDIYNYDYYKDTYEYSLPAKTVRKYYKHNYTVEGYQDLEYLESSGTQYINTGIVPKNTTIVEVKETAINTETNNTNGWGSSGNQEAFLWRIVGNSITICSVSSNWSEISMGQSALNTTHILYLKSGLQTMDGVTYGTSTIGSTATSGQTLYLYALHTEWGSGIQYAKTRIHYCKIWDGDTLVRDFIPVKRLSDGVIGLYDKVNNTLYTNNGSGIFAIKEIPYIIESDETDYDFYKDVDIYKALKSYEKGQYYGN